MRPDDVDVGIGFEAPDPVHQVLSGEHKARVQHEELDQLVFLICELDALVTGPHLIAVAVEDQVADLLEGIGIVLAPSAESLDAGDKLARGERLGEVIIGTGLKSCYPVFDLSFCSEHQYGGGDVVLADKREDFEAVHAGHHDI